VLNRIVHFSLRFRGVIILLAALVIVYGSYVAQKTKLDVFPEFAPPQVAVVTEAPGLSPEQVEQLVTRPLENGINGVANLHAIRSESIQGLSVITAVFAENTDIFRARQMINERLAEVSGALPQGVKAPTMGSLTSSTSLMLAFGLTSTNRTPMDLRTFADWTLRPRLLGVPGVAKVDTFGGEVEQIQVRVRPDRLLAYGLSIDDVLAAARKSTGVRGAGFVENKNQRIVLRTDGQSLTPEQLGETIIAHTNGQSVRLKDVAEVASGAEPKLGDSQINGQDGVVMLAYSQYGANTMEVTKAVEAALEEMKPAMAAEKITFHPRLFRPATFIENSLRNIDHSLLWGGVLVVVVLFLFLLDLRTAFISFVSIPLSLLAAVIALNHFGITINTITLGGFAIAIGVVVDDGIIDVENILRRLRENQSRPNPEPLPKIILHASLEVRSAVVYATFVVALVFLPVLMMSGVQGRLFSPLAVSFILAIFASLAVALTVTPALCFVMLSRIKPHSEPGYLTRFKTRHRQWLNGLSRRPNTVIVLAVLLCLAAAATLPFFGGEFLPEFRENHYILHMAAFPGTSLAQSLDLGRRVTEELLKNPHIASVSQEAGRAELGEDVLDNWGTHLSEIHIDLKPLSGEEADAVETEIRQTVAKFPGAAFKMNSFLAERMEETISGSTAEVVINVFGDDLNALDSISAEIRGLVSKIPGAVDPLVQSQPGAPELVVRLKADRLVQFGFAPLDVLDAIQTAYEAADVAQVFQGNRVVGVTVILDENSRRDPEAVGSLVLHNAEGLRMPLRELANVYLSTGRSMVVHESARRRQQVTCDVAGRDLASFVREARQKIQALKLPPGVYVSFSGAAEAQAAAKNELLVHSLLAAVGIIVLLWIVFGAWQNLLLVLANLPFALVGGVLAVFATGGSISIGSLVGFVTLFGITMRNSILMISHFDHLVTQEGMTWSLATAIRGANERLVPILMTALVTALGLLPLAIGSGEAGREIEGPMAIVILGGLLTSTVLNLLVLPTLALRYGKFGKTDSLATLN
jgi:CzcA family heavy metal efflux pump